MTQVSWSTYSGHVTYYGLLHINLSGTKKNTCRQAWSSDQMFIWDLVECCPAGNNVRTTPWSQGWSRTSRGETRHHWVPRYIQLPDKAAHAANSYLADWTAERLFTPIASHAQGIHHSSSLWPVGDFGIYHVTVEDPYYESRLYHKTAQILFFPLSIAWWVIYTVKACRKVISPS